MLIPGQTTPTVLASEADADLSIAACRVDPPNHRGLVGIGEDDYSSFSCLTLSPVKVRSSKEYQSANQCLKLIEDAEGISLGNDCDYLIGVMWCVQDDTHWAKCGGTEDGNTAEDHYYAMDRGLESGEDIGYRFPRETVLEAVACRVIQWVDSPFHPDGWDEQGGFQCTHQQQ